VLGYQVGCGDCTSPVQKEVNPLFQNVQLSKLSRLSKLSGFRSGFHVQLTDESKTVRGVALEKGISWWIGKEDWLRWPQFGEVRYTRGWITS
jgi:hypothetical protein